MCDTVPAKGNLFGKWLPARYMFAVLGSIGLAIVYGLKVNLSVALVAMLNHTAFENENFENKNNASLDISECSADVMSNNNPQQNGPFAWSTPLQGTILSCYFWGYLVAQIPGAYVAEKFSAKWVMLFSVAINVVCTLFTPLFTKIHYSGLILMRVLEGIGGGVTFPAMHCMLGSWAPPNERSIMSTITYVGTAFGTGVSILTSGIIAANLGWECIFYIHGGLSTIWIFLWGFLIQDSPNKQYFISEEERQFITSRLGEIPGKTKEKKLPVPWKKICTSMPFLAILVAHICSNWGWYLFLIELPFYSKQVLKFDVSSNAIFSALPYIPMLILSIVLGKSLDILRDKGIINTGGARKIATGIASIVPIICLFILCFIGCRPVGAVVVMTVGVTSIGAMFCGFLTNHIDLANNYAGTLVAITNTLATISGILVPIFVGYITEGNETIEAWRTIFYVTIAFFAIEVTVFTLFGSGLEQQWNRQNKIDQDDEEQPLNAK